MSEPDWSNLIAAAGRSDEQAWQTIVEQLRPLLRQLADRQLDAQVRQRVEPSDVVQESLADAWKGRAGFHGASKGELIAWLHTIVEHNVQDAVREHIEADKRSIKHERSLDELRSSGAFHPEVFVAGELSPRSELARREAVEGVARFLDDLPPQQRKAVELRYFEHCTLAEMASRLQLNENAAAQLLHRGVSNLRHRHEQVQSPSC
jgi:RNA polymerase sigma-70 factor (ECF subfamily)